MERTESITEILDIVGNTGLPAKPRKAENAFDYGDAGTVGFHVKRVGYAIGNDDVDIDNTFGVYMGQHAGKFAVAVKQLDGDVCAVELFDTEEEMKKAWRLD